MEAIGLVFLYNRQQGEPTEISKMMSEYFAGITEHLVTEGLMGLNDLKKIMDNKYIYWGGIKENFSQLLDQEEKIGGIAIELFESYSGEKAQDEVKSLIYDGEQAPWGFTLIACVLYK
ncbi:MAG: hypothetical protein ACTSR8_07830 [Promethearchaeota archaeon]